MVESDTWCTRGVDVQKRKRYSHDDPWGAKLRCLGFSQVRKGSQGKVLGSGVTKFKVIWAITPDIECQVNRMGPAGSVHCTAPGDVVHTEHTRRPVPRAVRCAVLNQGKKLNVWPETYRGAIIFQERGEKTLNFGSGRGMNLKHFAKLI